MTATRVDFTREGVQPPSRFYLRPFQRYEIHSWCSVAGITLSIPGLILTPSGSVQEIAEIHEPNADRSEASDLFFLPEGFLLHLQVSVKAGALLPGECFVTVHIVRGLAGASVRVSTLFADYVTPLVSPTYPVSGINQSVSQTGAVKSITGTDPIAGAEISETVPVNARWLLHTLQLELVTAVGGANRTITLKITDGANTILQCASTTVIPPSQTWCLCYSVNGIPEVTIGTLITLSIPPLPLLPGYTIITDTANLIAGDNYAAPQLFVEEWLIE